MRLLVPFLLFVQVAVVQPGGPSFCFVLAEPRGAERPLKRPVTILQRYSERIPYVGTSGSWLKSEMEQTLYPGPLFHAKGKGWEVVHPLEAMANSYVLVVSDMDTMRIDMPEDLRQLIDRAWRRWDRDTPEVLRFRKGRYAIEELVAAPWAIAAANTLARRLIAEDDAAYKKQLADQEDHYRNQPPPSPPPVPHIPPPPMTEEQWAAYWAEQPPLKEARLERVSADTVWVWITGRVMLNGGCGSGMPLFGVEILTDTGWVERIPFELTQMDCGMPWADWEDREVMMPPLRWWVGANSAEGRRTLVPGSYRLFFVGGNGKQKRTAPFIVE